jgi:hypothetical protein
MIHSDVIAVHLGEILDLDQCDSSRRILSA